MKESIKKASCLIIAGEKSGEEHCLSFLPQLLELKPGVNYFGVGGNSLQNLGMELIYHLNDFSSWGYSEVFAKIPFYISAMNRICSEVEKRQCKVAILIDFQNFNLALAKKLSRQGVKVLYYVAPQAWAWKSRRCKILARSVHTLFTIIPFEKKWFFSKGVGKIKAVIHPTLTNLAADLEKNLQKVNSKKVQSNQQVNLLMLPGSRNFEVRGLLSNFLEAAELLAAEFNVEIGILPSSSVKDEIFKSFFDRYQTKLKIKLFQDLSKSLNWAHLAIAASGTITLSCALYQIPTVVCYRASFLNEFLYRTFVRYKGPIALANIVHAQDPFCKQNLVYPELIQEEVSSFNIKKYLSSWLTEAYEYEKIKKRLASTAELIQGEKFDISEYINQVIQEAYA